MSSTVDQLTSDEPTALEQRLAEPITRDPASQALTLRDEVDYSRALAKAGEVLPPTFRDNPGAILWAVAYARALDLEPPIVMQGMTLVKGTVGWKAEMIATLVRRRGHRLRVGNGTDARGLPTGWAEIVRKDDPGFTYRTEWTIDRAVAAGLCAVVDGKVHARSQRGEVLPWEAHTASMVKRRATAEVARDACPEVLMGVRVEDELEEITEPAEPVRVPSEPGGSVRAAAEAARNVRVEHVAPRTTTDTTTAAQAAQAVAEGAAGIARAVAERRAEPAYVVDGDVVEDRTIDADAVRTLNIALSNAGYRTSPAKLKKMSEVLGRPVESSKHLTVGEHHAVLVDLNADGPTDAAPPAPPEPTAPLDGDGLDADDQARTTLLDGIARAARAAGWSLERLNTRVLEVTGTTPDLADLADLAELLDQLQTGTTS